MVGITGCLRRVCLVPGVRLEASRRIKPSHVPAALPELSPFALRPPSSWAVAVCALALKRRRLPATKCSLDRLGGLERQIFAPLLRHDLHTNRQPFR